MVIEFGEILNRIHVLLSLEMKKFFAQSPFNIW